MCSSRPHSFEPTPNLSGHVWAPCLATQGYQSCKTNCQQPPAKMQCKQCKHLCTDCKPCKTTATCCELSPGCAAALATTSTLPLVRLKRKQNKQATTNPQARRPSLLQLCDLLQSSAIEPASPTPRPRRWGHVQMRPSVNIVLCDPKRQFAQLETQRKRKTAVRGHARQAMCPAMLLTQSSKPQTPRPFKLRHLSQDILRMQKHAATQN